MKQLTEHEINVMAEDFSDTHLDALSNKWLAMRFAFREGFKAAVKLNENIMERCKMDSLENKDHPECANVLGRCMICKHYSESISDQT